MNYRLPLARSFARANRLDYPIHSVDGARFGLLSAGKTFSDVVYALRLLGIDAPRAHQLRLDIYKVGMIWPLEEQGLREFAKSLDELLVIEEKRPFLESQVAMALYGASNRPRLSGKRSPDGSELIAADGTLSPGVIAMAIAARLEAGGLADEELRAKCTQLRRRLAAQPAAIIPESPTPADMLGGHIRTPYFCSGCPHNTSTRVPAGSVAMSGIGCHTMALRMGRNTLPPTHMGGEGTNWIGISPFVDTPHVFQNLGDGTYFHSGLLAIRAACAARVNITYKILFNAVVAMTGGQPIDGQLTVGDVVRQVLAEGIARCVVVSSAPDSIRSQGMLPAGVVVHDRSELDRVQRELREVKGVTILVYDQICAAEKRRQIKRRM